MKLLRAYYKTCCYILRQHIPTMPELKITESKKYRGQIEKRQNEFKCIRLSKHYLLNDDKFGIDEEEREEIIEVICHELAHMLFWDHSEDHTEATKLFKTVVKSELTIRSIESLLAM